MTVYVLHISPRYRHAAHYIGYTPDETAERRVNEHLSGSCKGSSLIRAALDAGCKVSLAHEYPGAGRDFERNLKNRRDTAKWCALCGNNKRSLPQPSGMSEKFKASKPTAEDFACQAGGVA